MKISKKRDVLGKLIQDRVHRFQVGNRVLKPREFITIRVVSFVFRFRTIEQLKACIELCEKKTHPSSRISGKVLAGDIGEDRRELRGWEVERWFERLPMYVLEEPKRQKVLKALHKALALESAGRLRS